MKYLWAIALGLAGWIATNGAVGDVIVVGSAPVVDAKQRDAIAAATETLQYAPNNLGALEILLELAGLAGIQSMQGGLVISSTDPVIRAAGIVLQDWYATDFLDRVLREGSEGAAWWALQKLAQQELNSYDGYRKGERRLAGSAHLLARHGLITPAVKRAVLPALLKRTTTGSAAMQQAFKELIAKFGLLADPQAFLAALEDPDELRVAEAVRAMIHTTRVDPLLTPRIWELLRTAKTHELQAACLTYPWLFEVPVFTEEMRNTLLMLHRVQVTDVLTNWNYAMAHLSLSTNPQVLTIFAALESAGEAGVREQLVEHRKTYALCLADDKLQGVPPAVAVAEPIYQGKSLSAWLEDLYFVGMVDPDRRAAAQAAVRVIGVAGLPVLVNRLRVCDPPVDAVGDQQTMAAFGVLGAVAAPAIPELITLLAQAYDAAHSTRSGSVTTELKERKTTACIQALRFIGEKSVPALVTALGSEQMELFRFGAAAALEQFRAEAPVTVPALIVALDDMSPGVRWRAARTIGALTIQPEAAVPALVKRLREDEDVNVKCYVCMALGRFGLAARPAIAALTLAAGGEDSGLRWRAREALAEIKRAAEKCAKSAGDIGTGAAA